MKIVEVNGDSFEKLARRFVLYCGKKDLLVDESLDCQFLLQFRRKAAINLIERVIVPRDKITLIYFSSIFASFYFQKIYWIFSSKTIDQI